ncbi:MAG: hypothetical protein N2423_05745 [Novosphingobium sp.]|nr:hypothetical protein [Novosphingobium sp.]
MMLPASGLNCTIHCRAHVAAIAAMAMLSISLDASAQATQSVTIGSLIAGGGKVQDLFASQEYPYFIVIAADGKPFICALSVDEAFQFFDYRQPNPPAGIGSRCSELK